MSENLAQGLALAIMKEALGDRAPEISLEKLAAIPPDPGAEVLIEDLSAVAPTATAMFMAAASIASLLDGAEDVLSHREYHFLSDLITSLRETTYTILWLNTGMKAVPKGSLEIRMQDGKMVLMGVKKEAEGLKERLPGIMSRVKEKLEEQFPGATVILGTPPGLVD